jgi:uncharacterized protein YcaQ
LARPLAITDQVKEKILEAIRGGNFREVAARYAGVSPKTLHVYLKRRDDEARAFRIAVLEAEAKVEIDIVGAINTMARTNDIKAGTWYLARKFSGRWADQSKELKELLELLREQKRAQSDDTDD